jgi:uroporphyrinogen decarboxylase
LLPRVEQLPRPDPDVSNLLTVLRHGRPARLPMLEIKLDDEVQAELLGEPLIGWRKTDPPERRRAACRQHIGLMRRLGYDAFRIKAPQPFKAMKERASDTAVHSRGQREWQSEHEGVIQSWDDFERYVWPTGADLDFTFAQDVLRELPEGMGAIAYSSGVFEWSSWLMGLENFLIAFCEEPELIRAITQRVGPVILKSLETMAQMDGIVAVWVADDLGFKTSTMISPADLREYILPWHTRYAAMAHAHGKPMLFHCCGNVKQIMRDLVEDVKIDAKHSFEDVIQPVEEFSQEWQDRIAVIGGVDIDLLARQDENVIAQRTQQILEACAPKGGYAAGSGNSVPNYVPVNHYLAMVETIHRYNGRM